jgi:hypothetical protein
MVVLVAAAVVARICCVNTKCLFLVYIFLVK